MRLGGKRVQLPPREANELTASDRRILLAHWYCKALKKKVCP